MTTHPTNSPQALGAAVLVGAAVTDAATGAAVGLAAGSVGLRVALGTAAATTTAGAAASISDWAAGTWHAVSMITNKPFRQNARNGCMIPPILDTAFVDQTANVEL